jgi:hypothetical protein
MADELAAAPLDGETLEIRPPAERRAGPGRPVGARNKRSQDLARYIEHAYGGMTPGQQSAAVALISPDDVAAAPGDAQQLGLIDLGLDPVTLAMAVKAKRLAKALGCEPFEAWALMARERDGLMKYVHQVRPPARESGAAPATVYLVPEGQLIDAPLGQLPGDEQDPDFPELFQSAGGAGPTVDVPRREES